MKGLIIVNVVSISSIQSNKQNTNHDKVIITVLLNISLGYSIVQFAVPVYCSDSISARTSKPRIYFCELIVLYTVADGIKKEFINYV